MALGTRKKLLVVALAAIMLVGCGGKEERKAKYLERGKAFIAEENWDKAGVEIKNVLQIDPKSAEGYYLMGQIEEKKQEWIKSFNNYSKAVELDPDMIDARARLAQFYMLQVSAYKERGERDREANALGLAQAEIDEIIKRDAQNSAAHTLHASILMREGKIDEAIAAAESVIKAEPAYSPANILLSELYQQKGNFTEAENVLLSAAANAEDPLPLKQILAQLYARQNKNDAVEDILRELSSARPDDLSYQVQLAMFLAQNNKVDKAEAVMQEAISAAPDDIKRYRMLADLLATKKSVAAGIEFLQQSIRKMPGASDLQLDLARLYERDNKLNEAMKIYEGMVARHGEEPSGLLARNRLAIHAAAAGDMDTAFRYTNEVLTKNPTDNEALQMKGRLAMQQSDFDTAVASFRSVLKDQPDSVPVLHLLAEAQLRKGDIELAEDNLRRAMEVAPQNADARLKYARYLIAKKDPASALEHIDAVLNKDPENAEAIAAKSEVLAAAGDLASAKDELVKLKEVAPDNAESSLRLARIYMAEGNSSAAMDEVDVVLGHDEKNKAALLMKTEILASTEDTVALQAAIKRLKALLPNDPEGPFRMGRFLQGKGDIAGAMKEYEQAYTLANDAGKVIMLSEIVNAHIAFGQAEQALARLQALQREDPENKVSNAYGLLGIVQMVRKDYNAAEIAFTKQIELNPDSATLYAQLSAAREQQGNIAGAVAAFEQGMGVFKENVNLQMGLAGLYERQGMIDEAIELYENVLTKQPDNAIGVNNLASLLSDHRTDEKSLARAKELAAKLEPVQQPALRDTLGWVHYRTGDYVKAVEVLEGVVNTNPKAAIFQYHLGMAYAKTGDKVKAKAALTKALELGDFPGADEAREVLGSL